MSESDMMNFTDAEKYRYFIKSHFYDILIDAFENGKDESYLLRNAIDYICKLMQADAWSLLLTPENVPWTFYLWHPVYDKIDLVGVANEIYEKRSENIISLISGKRVSYITYPKHRSDWAQPIIGTKVWVGIKITYNEKVVAIVNIDYFERKKFLKKYLKVAQIAAVELERLLKYFTSISKVVAEGTLDALTGLYSRAKWENDKGELFKAGGVIVFIDLDDFKMVNDTYGHIIGDDTLRIIGKRINYAVKQGVDRVYRYGGDEFVIYLKRCGECKQVIERLKETIEKPIILDGCVVKVGMSYGKVKLSEFNSIDEAFKAADAMMYECKKKKKELNG
ncbi:MAG TPA: GGDEF domain-containing protein [Fervidobacterium sp.]|nr:GGDEF domain-containing protein [Fervidobacterium sp.]